MDRRNFIKNCSLAVSGFTVFKNFNLLFANNESINSFSLSLITNNPETAILKVEKLINNSILKHKNVRYTEYSISGNHIGDMVLIKNNNLINFRTLNDDLSKNLQQISKELGLLKNLENPSFLKFYTENKARTPKRIQVFHQNALINQFDINTEKDFFEIKGSKGYVTISIKNKKVKIISSSCIHKTCIKMGSINKPGQNLVCIPNQLRISIEGKNEFGIDGISY